MNPKTAPTSPKYPLEHDVNKVWAHPSITPPTKVPVGIIMVVSFLTGLVTLALGVVGLVWFMWAHPNNPLVKALPSTVTTIIQSVPTNYKDLAPEVVNKAADSVVSIFPTTTATTITNDVVVGQGVVLGSSGWIWTLRNSLPAGSTSSVATAREVASSPSSVSDPLSSAVFLKTTLKSGQAMDVADTSKIVDGQRVWVITRRLQTVAVTMRHLHELGSLGWQTCERFVDTWSLDQPMSDTAGGVVVNDKGQAIGLIDSQGFLQLSDFVQPVFDQVISRGTIDRPSCGFRLTTTSAALAIKAQGATTWLVGATGSDVAVTAKSPADLAGLKSGDSITSIDGTKVSDDPGTYFRSLRLGQKIQLAVTRNTKTLNLSLTVGVVKE